MTFSPPRAAFKSSDAARRCADTVSMHAMVPGAVGRWCAIGLADGRSDNTIYDTREDAIRHQLRPEFCWYVQVIPGGMQAGEAEEGLRYWRMLADANVSDTSDALLPLMPLTKADRARQVQLLTRGSH